MAITLSTWTNPSNGQVRRYVSGWEEAAGIEVWHYKTGNVAGATYQGKAIANNRATHIGNIKVWVDEDRMVYIENVSDRLERCGITGDSLYDDIIPAISKALDA